MRTLKVKKYCPACNSKNIFHDIKKIHGKIVEITLMCRECDYDEFDTIKERK